MQHFLVQASYAPSAMNAMVQSPEDRSHIISATIAKLGGKVEGFWLSFGDFDVVLIVQMPNEQAMAAFSMAAAAGGAVRSVKSTLLLSWEEGMLALRQAGQIGYRPPGGATSR